MLRGACNSAVPLGNYGLRCSTNGSGGAGSGGGINVRGPRRRIGPVGLIKQPKYALQQCVRQRGERGWRSLGAGGRLRPWGCHAGCGQGQISAAVRTGAPVKWGPAAATSIMPASQPPGRGIASMRAISAALHPPCPPCSLGAAVHACCNGSPHMLPFCPHWTEDRARRRRPRMLMRQTAKCLHLLHRST